MDRQRQQRFWRAGLPALGVISLVWALTTFPATATTILIWVVSLYACWFIPVTVLGYFSYVFKGTKFSYKGGMVHKLEDGYGGAFIIISSLLFLGVLVTLCYAMDVWNLYEQIEKIFYP